MPAISKIAVLGGGTMGSGIARFFSGQGLYVTLYDPNPAALSNAKKKLISSGNGDADIVSAAVIEYTTDAGQAVKEANLVIETAPEDLSIKLELYKSIAPFLKNNAIVASNTSSFSLEKLSAGQPFASRMIIMHFFNPAHLIPLVEIVAAEHTTPKLAQHIADFLETCGKKPIVLKKDIYGFIANRLQAAVVREACFLVEQGVADPSQIDSAMKDGLGIRWVLNGPFEIADFGGLDIWEKVLNNLLPLLDNSQQASGLFHTKVEQQQLGLKTGQGFFNYSGTTSVKKENSRNKKLIDLQKALGQINKGPGKIG